MRYRLRFAKRAAETVQELEHGDGNQQAKLKEVRRALSRLEQNPRHPSLASHPYESFPVDRDVKVWDSYVENHRPSAWRIFWRYGPDEGVSRSSRSSPSRRIPDRQRDGHVTR